MNNYQNTLLYNVFLLIIITITIIRCLLAFCIPEKSIYKSEEQEFTGQILQYKMNGDLLSITLKCKEPLILFYTISTPEEKEKLEKTIGYGQTIKIKGNLEVPNNASLPNTFDYQEYLYYKHIHYIVKGKEITVIKKENIFYQWKNSICTYLKKFVHYEYFQAFLLGDNSDLDLEASKKNGITHLFAVSGMHVSYLLIILKRILKKQNIMNQMIIISVLYFYSFLVNFSPSILRVFVMYCFMQINKYFQLNFSKKQLFYMTFCCLLLIEPFYLKNIGFQFSFLICFGFLLLQKDQKRWKNTVRKTLSAFFISLPISGIHFFEVNLLTIILNLMFIPLVSIIIYPLCLLTLIIPYFSSIFSFFIDLFEITNNWFANFTFGTMILPKIPIIFWIFYYCVYFLLLKADKGQYKYYLFLFVILFCIKIYPKLNQNCMVYFLDVGQGDATLFVSPYQQEIILIDTGGKITRQMKEWQRKKQTSTETEKIVLFLHSLGIKKLHYIILTHGDIDHVGNALPLLEQIGVDKIILNKNDDTELEKTIRNKYSEKITEKIYTKYFQIAEFTFDEETNENDASLIYQINCFGIKFLMMGDASQKVERKIQNMPIESDVIKIGHHGSKSSSSKSFLKQVNPKYAIISAGKNNIYHHPNIETLNTLNDLKIPYLETQQYHTIIFKVTKEQKLIMDI